MRRRLLGAVVVLAIAALVPLAGRSCRAKVAHATPIDEPLAKIASASLAPPPPPMTGLDLTKIGFDDGGASAPMAEKKTARLTIDAYLQRTSLSILAQHKLPEAAIVLLDPETGHVLAYASHVEVGPTRDLCAEATAPAASVFKIVTGAALVETGVVGPDTRQCYSGGEQKILASDLEDDPVRDRWCATLSGATGRSLNTVFARLALKHLKPPMLEETAKAFGFGEPLPFDVPVQTSQVHIPLDTLGFARTAAGFWNTTLSPLEAAQISATIARGGEAIRPSIVAQVADASGKPLWTATDAPTPLHRAVTPEAAQALTTMMEHTVSEGTSYRAFHDARGTPFLPGISVAGKTGTLTDDKLRRFYTWFTGFAPSRPLPGVKPIAVAVLVVNLPTWQVKANVVAREILHAYFADRKVPSVLRPARIAHRD
jgi:cell division protein FtsI/penicillin-binding protein 2